MTTSTPERNPRDPTHEAPLPVISPPDHHTGNHHRKGEPMTLADSIDMTSVQAIRSRKHESGQKCHYPYKELADVAVHPLHLSATEAAS
jgi:hypothetical protein